VYRGPRIAPGRCTEFQRPTPRTTSTRTCVVRPSGLEPAAYRLGDRDRRLRSWVLVSEITHQVPVCPRVRLEYCTPSCTWESTWHRRRRGMPRPSDSGWSARVKSADDERTAVAPRQHREASAAGASTRSSAVSQVAQPVGSRRLPTSRLSTAACRTDRRRSRRRPR
jgi:hypothetical protein